MSNRWNKEDCEKLQSLWKTAEKDELLQAFPKRTWQKILLKGRSLGLLDRTRERSIPVNEAFFSAWSPDMAYVLGFWFADGSMTQPDKDAFITFSSNDRDHLVLIRDIMQSGHSVHPQGDNCFQLHIGSKQLWNDLYAVGGIPAKSRVAEMPPVPNEYMRHFVRGFVDGDGSLYWETSVRRSPRIWMGGGEAFLSGMALQIDEHTGTGVAKIRCPKSGKLPFIAYSGIKAKVFAKWLYSDTEVVLTRKAQLAREFEGWEPSKFGWRSIACITPKMRGILGQ